MEQAPTVCEQRSKRKVQRDLPKATGHHLIAIRSRHVEIILTRQSGSRIAGQNEKQTEARSRESRALSPCPYFVCKDTLQTRRKHRQLRGQARRCTGGSRLLFCSTSSAMDRPPTWSSYHSSASTIACIHFTRSSFTISGGFMNKKHVHGFALFPCCSMSSACVVVQRNRNGSVAKTKEVIRHVIGFMGSRVRK